MNTFLKATVITLTILSGVTYYSCNKSNLDLLPHGPTEQSFFTQESDFQKAVYGVYAKINDVYWYNAGADNSTMPIYLLPGDDITTNEGNEEFEQFGSIQPSSGRVNYFYTIWYQLNARANVLLEKINNVADDIYVTPNLKVYNKGETLLL